MRKLFYFLVFLFIACVACDSKDEPETPPAPPKPKPEPISPKDSIYNMLSGIWDIDSVETFKFGRKTGLHEFVLIGYSKVKYLGNEYLKLEENSMFRKEENQEKYYHTGGKYGMRGDTAYVDSYEIISTFEWISYYHSNRKARIYKTEIKRDKYHKDSIISVHRKTKNLPK